jgi:hypothetical protein
MHSSRCLESHEQSLHSRRNMKPGDLVRGSAQLRLVSPVLGIIVGESPRTNTWGDQVIRWWWVLTVDGRLEQEVERYMEIIQKRETET